jgi:poly(3-hydroxybutyrate) depolymerase
MRLGSRAAISGLALLLSLPALAACIPPAKADATLLVDRLRVTVHYSPSTAPRPLVVALHGLNSTGADFARVTALSQYADAHHFVVAYPDAHLVSAQPVPVPTSTPTPSPSPTPSASPPPAAEPSAPYGGVVPSAGLNNLRAQLAAGVVENGRVLSTVTTSERAWNAGVCCGGSTADDVKYLRDVVAAVERRTPIDRRRIYVIGLSNGGMMALKAVCEAPDVFAAAGSVAGPYLGSSCKRPVWVHLHDAKDPIVPYFGGHPPGSTFLHIANNWCLCAFPSSATEARRFSLRTVSVKMVAKGVHSWPRVGDKAWNFDANANLWAWVSRFHL